MKKVELLAPAGSMESLKAAINAGADAIYLGGYMFGARSFSSNFSDEEIVEAIKYAHIMDVKIYVTVNTLVYENEVDMFMSYVDFLHQNNVDAVIVQDIGMLDLLRKTYPNLEIHASTQMHIHNLEGALLLQKLGIKRTVLARETSILEIENIKKNSSIDLEIFVHGALCVSYSGQCLMSSMIGNRSGNRGTCAQTCRKKYKLDGTNIEGYLISPKDLYTLENIGSLLDIGVSSLKIEGRMKRPEYVYHIVSIYRKAIDEYYNNKKIVVSKEDEIGAKKLFNREFTKGFLFNEDNSNFTNPYRPNHMGIEIGEVVSYKDGNVFIKLIDNVSINDGIRIIDREDVGLNLNNFYINSKLVKTATKGDIINFKIPKSVLAKSKVVKTTDYLQIEDIKEKINNKKQIEIAGFINIVKGDYITLKVTDFINEVVVKSNSIVESANSAPITKENIIKQLSKTSETNYIFQNIEVSLGGNLFVSLKELNELRREALSLLDQKRLYEIPYVKKAYEITVQNFEKEKNINALIYNENQLSMLNKYSFNKIYTDNFKVENSIKRLPRVIINHEEGDSFLITEMGGLNKYSNFETDFSFNVTNSYAVAFLHNMGAKKVTLSHELTFEQTKEIINFYENRYKCHPNLEVIVYSYPEVMINKFNILKKYDLNNTYLIDELNNKYYVDQINDRMRIFNFEKKEEEFIKYFEIGINNVRFDIAPFDKLPKINY